MPTTVYELDADWLPDGSNVSAKHNTQFNGIKLSTNYLTNRSFWMFTGYGLEAGPITGLIPTPYNVYTIYFEDGEDVTMYGHTRHIMPTASPQSLIGEVEAWNITYQAEVDNGNVADPA